MYRISTYLPNIQKKKPLHLVQTLVLFSTISLTSAQSKLLSFTVDCVNRELLFRVCIKQKISYKYFTFLRFVIFCLAADHTSCRYNCGYNFGSCSCTSSCQRYGNCCHDYNGNLTTSLVFWWLSDSWN